jgi:hypothetical protein
VTITLLSLFTQLNIPCTIAYHWFTIPPRYTVHTSSAIRYHGYACTPSGKHDAPPVCVRDSARTWLISPRSFQTKSPSLSPTHIAATQVRFRAV